jgi:hypothetical protein
MVPRFESDAAISQCPLSRTWKASTPIGSRATGLGEGGVGVGSVEGVGVSLGRAMGDAIVGAAVGTVVPQATRATASTGSSQVRDRKEGRIWGPA